MDYYTEVTAADSELQHKPVTATVTAPDPNQRLHAANKLEHCLNMLLPRAQPQTHI
jgi:hypothetical protein